MTTQNPTFQRWRAFFQKSTEAVPPYLLLLNAHQPEENARAIRVCLQCLKQSPDPSADILEFLQQHNWRFHIAASVALVCGLRTPSLFPALWTALRSGSWASPQMAAAAFLSDPDFHREAPRHLFTSKIVMGEGAKILPPLGGLGLSPPTPQAALTSKGIAALALLYPKLPNPEPAVLSLLHAPPMQTILAHEELIDAGGQIALQWAERMTNFAGLLQKL